MAHNNPHGNYEPKSRLAKWLNDRLPIPELMYHFNSFPTPKNLNWMWVFGAVLTVFLGIQIVTGIVLAMHYTPNVDLAFASVEHIMRDVNSGWLMRYMHANGASFFFIAVYLHIFRGLYYGSYKKPREIIWIVGIFIFLIMIATAFLGYVLPWGQMSFWGATVITSLASAIPVVGEDIAIWLWGGFSVDNPTLNRFYALHYLFPFIIAALVGLHIWGVHHVGNSNPAGIEVRPRSVKRDTVPFSPYFVVKDLFAVALVLLIFIIFVFFMPNFLGHPDNYIEANPLVTPEHIVPEWYFLPFYAILRSITFDLFGPFDAKFLGVMAMFGSIAVLALAPWLDISKVKSTRFRPYYKIWYWFLICDFLLLMWCGAQNPEGIALILSQIATCYWFFHFVILLPLLGYFEKSLDLPKSIEDDFSAKNTANKEG